MGAGMDHHEMKSEGPWPMGWLWAVVAALVAAGLSRWLGNAPMAGAVVLGLAVFVVYSVLLGQFWEEPPHGDHDHGHGGHGHGHH